MDKFLLKGRGKFLQEKRVQLLSKNATRRVVPPCRDGAFCQPRGCAPRFCCIALDTPLGRMLAVADSERIYFLGFADCTGTSRAIDRLLLSEQASMGIALAPLFSLLAEELELYFSKKHTEFRLPSFAYRLPILVRPFNRRPLPPYARFPTALR
ncbi:MAG: hypothetical protein AAGF04_03565 [Chlamydiota bacterium]